MELLGVYDKSLVEPLAAVMSRLGVKRGMVVFGQEGLDEISSSAPTSVCEIRDGWFQSYEIDPGMYGLPLSRHEDLVGGTPEENAEITRLILSSKEKGAKRNAVLLNAGASFYIAGKTESIKDGIALAESLIDGGKAEAKLNEFIMESAL